MPLTDEQVEAFYTAVATLQTKTHELKDAISEMKQSQHSHIRDGAKHFEKAVEELEHGIADFKKEIDSR